MVTLRCSNGDNLTFLLLRDANGIIVFETTFIITSNIEKLK
jgi:hypothetical protein